MRLNRLFVGLASFAAAVGCGRVAESDGDGACCRVEQGRLPPDIDGGTDLDAGHPTTDAGSVSSEFVRWGTSGHDWVAEVEPHPGGGVAIAGSYTGWNDVLRIGRFALEDHSAADGHNAADLFVARLDAQGEAIWARGFGGTWATVYANGLGVTKDGTMFVAGRYYGSPDLGTGPLPDLTDYPHYLAAFDETGRTRWVVPFSADATADAWLLTATSDEAIVVATFRGTYDFGGMALTHEGYAPAIVRYTPDGALHGAGTLFNPHGFAAVRSVVALANGHLAFSVETDGALEFKGELIDVPAPTTVIVVVDGDLNHRWHKMLNTSAASANESPNSVQSLRAARDGSLLVSGYYGTRWQFRGEEVTRLGAWTEGFVANFGPAGEEKWVQVIRSTAAQDAAAIPDAREDSTGAVTLIGHLAGRFELCGRPVGLEWSPDEYSSVVARLAPDGDCEWVRDFGAIGRSMSAGHVLPGEDVTQVFGTFERTAVHGGMQFDARRSDAFMLRIHR